MGKNKLVAKIIFAFLLWGFLFSWIIGCCLNVLYVYEKIDMKTLVLSALIAGLISDVLLLVILYRFAKKGKSTKFSNWIRNNYGKCIIVIVGITIFSASIKKNLVMSDKTIMEMVKIEWTIFTVSVALFVFWPTIIRRYFDDNRPQLSEKNNPVSLYNDLRKKRKYYSIVNSTFDLIFILFPNLVFLFVATYCCFLMTINVDTQTLVIFSFYLCTNSLTVIMYEIFTAIRVIKKNSVKDYMVSVDEFNNASIKAKEYKEKLMASEKRLNAAEQPKDISLLSVDEAVVVVCDYINAGIEHKMLEENDSDEFDASRLSEIIKDIIMKKNGHFTQIDVFNDLIDYVNKTDNESTNNDGVIK